MKEPFDIPFEKFKEYINEEVTFNLGHAYEFVLASAMVSRFADRFDDGTPMDVTPSSVEDVMLKYFAGLRAWEVEQPDGEVDTVVFDGSGLPPEVLYALANPSVRKTRDVQKLVTTAIYAVMKNSTLTRLSKNVISNDEPDLIEVICGGTTGQMKTKSDVDVFINGRENRAAGFSVKYGGVRQVGQFAGSDPIKNMIDGFSSFGMDVKSLVRPIKVAMGSVVGLYTDRKDPVIENDKRLLFTSVNGVFSQITKKFGKSWLSKERNIDAMSNGLLKAARGTEDDLEIIKSGFSFDKKSFEALSRGLVDSSKRGELSWKHMPTGNPTIALYSNNMLVFSIRFRFDADKKKTGYKVRFRLLVEIGKDIVKFIDKYRFIG